MTAVATAAELRRNRIVVATTIVVLCAVYGASVEAGLTSHFDHARYLDTIEYQREGLSYYDAHLRVFAEHGVQLSEIRSVRQPLIFLLWGLVPTGWLWGAYLTVVAATSVLLLRLTRHPIAVLPVTAYLLLAGRVPTSDPIDQWLLVELWALLPLVGSIVLWQRQRHAPAAAFAVIAFLIRELVIGYLVNALILSWRSGDRKAMVAWSTALAAAAAGYGVHAFLVTGKLAQSGQDAAIVGTGDPPRTVWEMTGWMVPGPDAIGFVIFAAAMYRLARRRRDLWPLLGLFALALAGLFVARPYWGFLFIPFAVLLSGEGAAELAAGEDPRIERPAIDRQGRATTAELPTADPGGT